MALLCVICYASAAAGAATRAGGDYAVAILLLILLLLVLLLPPTRPKPAWPRWESKGCSTPDPGRRSLVFCASFDGPENTKNPRDGTNGRGGGGTRWGIVARADRQAAVGAALSLYIY
jgi:hypothetical protein